MTIEQERKIIEEYKKGSTWVDMELKLGVGHTTINKVLTKNKVIARNKGQKHNWIKIRKLIEKEGEK